MADHVSILLQLVSALGASTMTTIGIIIYLLLNLDKAESLGAKFAKIFSYVTMRAERHAIAADIQSKIRRYRKDNAVGEIMKHGIKFKWVTDKSDLSSYIKDDNVVVLMSLHKNEAENFFNAIVQYTRLAVLPGVQNDIPSKTLTPIMLLMQDKIIREQRPEALPMFRDSILPTAIKENPTIESTMDKLTQVDKRGWFIPIYLNELQYVGSRLYELNDDKKDKILNDFLDFLINIIKYSPTSKPALSFKNQIFGLDILLVAKWWKAESDNVGAYTHQAKQAMLKELDSIYVVGSGPTINFARKVIDAIKTQNIATHMWTRNHKRKDKQGTKAVLALFRNQFVRKFNL